MTNVRPNALSLAVAVAISSSIITAQAMADRRLQTKSVDIHSNVHVEFTQSEVIVQPTVDDDRQPIPKSFTTTYPDQTQARAGYEVPSECFTDVLSGIDGGVSSVDQFETGKNDAAQKYTKVLKVGDEGVFKFIHNLAEKKLVIEVRNGMTDQDSIEAVRTQSGDIQPLDPLTKIASPEQLVAVLKGAHGRAGKLGEVDNYVALATLEVDQVEVNGRTFMRLVAAGDQPPGLQRLGQSLFINDEALLAAASSAYTQVHVLGKELQQIALNDLLSFHKPVGYVVHVEDDTQAYAVPEDCPKLEVTEAQGEVIVFRGQKQNPADVAFVEVLYDIWLQWYGCESPSPEAITRVKKDKVKSYRYIIRSKQMAMLERIAEQNNPEPAKGRKTTLTLKQKLSMLSYEQQLTTLLYYEYLQQALTVAMSDGADEFDLSIGQIKVTSSAFTPALMFNQLEKHFSFKPAIENLLNNQLFIQDIQGLIPAHIRINQVLDDAPEINKKLAFKVVSDTTRQMIKMVEMENNRKVLLLKEYGLTHLRRQVTFRIEKTTTSEKENLKTYQLKQRIDDELTQLRNELQQQNNLVQKLQPEVERLPEQEQRIRYALTTARNAQMAAELGIDDWDDILPFREQDRLIKNKVLKINQLITAIFAATGQSDEEAVKAKPVATEGECSIASVNKNALGYLQFIRQLLQQDIQVTDEKVPKRLAVFEVKPSLISKNEDDPDLPQDNKKLEDKSDQQPIKQQSTRTKLQQKVERTPELERQIHDARTGTTKVRNAQQAAEPGIDDWDDTRLPEEQTRLIRKRTNKIRQLIPATGLPDEEAVKAKTPLTEGKRDMTSVNKDDLGILQSFKQYLQQKRELTHRIIHKKLARIEVQLGLVPDSEKDPEIRCQAVHQHIRLQGALIAKELTERRNWLKSLQEQVDRIPILKKVISAAVEEISQDYNSQMAAELGINNWDDTQPPEKQARLTNQKIHEISQTVTPISVAPTSVVPSPVVPSPVVPSPIVPSPVVPSPVVPSPVVATPVALTSFATTGQTREEALREKLSAIESEQGITPDNEKDPEVRRQAIQQYLNKHEAQTAKQHLQQQSTRQNTAKEAEIKTRYTTIAAHSDMQDFDTQIDSFTHAGKGAQSYDDEIFSMGSAAIYYMEHGSEDLKSFMEYFSARSASGNKIITLLREGLISKVELENYMKAARGVGGYEIEQEFEHFLGYKHGMRVAEFKSVVRMLSEKGIEEFVQTAFTPVTTTGPAAMKESVTGMKEYAAAVIANYILDDIAFDNGRRTAAFLTHLQDTLTPYANAAGISESELIQTVHGTLMQAHAAAVEQQLNDYWVKPSAFLLQAVTWYYSSYKPLLVTHTTLQAAERSLSNMSFLYLLDLTNRGDYLQRILTPFQHWLQRYGVDLDRTVQYACHSGIEQISEVSGLAMPLGKAASSVILLKTGSMLFARQHNANPHRYRSISRLVPEMVKSMGSGQGVQIPLLHRVTPQKVKTLASATVGLVLGPVATVGAYAHGLVSGFTYAQTFGFALASSLTFDFFMNDNKMLSQWLGGSLGRSLDKMNRWTGMGERQDEYVQRTAIASPQRFNETDAAYTKRVKASNRMHGWTQHENYLQFRERRDRTIKMFANGWEKYFRENVPKWSFSHSESIPYSYTLGVFYERKAALTDHKVEKFDLDKDKNTRDEL
ncbi:hypothetical protein [Endozoicomonas sp. 8E]|uniref:hypothetical protein n=1 Tax=Endozoicomonas sp. 8E TaxID=3035692 RepID=UPI002938D61F|nr:hypothetical protein [Endozoicomonas sp. 8E]WOG29578.1 hypothetical protein P6910_07980 [Endozoicomonas sp. 8E]